MEQLAIIFKLLLFLLWLNFLPPLAYLIWEESYDRPLDGGKSFIDGQPFFGPHKTVRGTFICLIGSLAFTPILASDWKNLLIAAALGITGDLCTSFFKRRFRLSSGKQLPLLDHLLEGLLPILYLGRYLPMHAAYHHLQLSWFQVLTVMSLFVISAYPASLLWQQAIYRPALKDYPKIVRGTTRPRRWRACHLPLARYHTFFNFENFVLYRILIAYSFKLTGLYSRGMRNALEIEVATHHFSFADLPPQFDGFKVLLLTDLHLDGLPTLTDRIIDKVKDIEVDLCLFGGDLRMEVYGPAAPSLRQLRRLLPHIKSRHGIVGVLGNHDCIEMLPDLEEAGIFMLVNDSWYIEQNGARLWIAGIDDPHFYRVHDAAKAFSAIEAGAFTIFLAHSPEAYQEAASFQPALYLCGHTHGGQICLAGRKPIFTNSSAPRYTASGAWQYGKMAGLTSRGVGASGVPIRFHCPGEINLIHLNLN